MTLNYYRACLTFILFFAYSYGTLTGLASDVSYGQRQIDQIMSDRPGMREIINEKDAVWIWVKQQLEGESTGRRVYWDNREPKSGRPAEHLIPYFDYPAMIRVTVDRKVSGVDKWVMLVYELHSLKNWKSFQALARAAQNGKLDRECYATQCLKLEFKAIEETVQFFRAHPIDVEDGELHMNYKKMMNFSYDFPAYVRALDNKATDPRLHYRRWYDKAIENTGNKFAPSENPIRAKKGDAAKAPD